MREEDAAIYAAWCDLYREMELRNMEGVIFEEWTSIQDACSFGNASLDSRGERAD